MPLPGVAPPPLPGRIHLPPPLPAPYSGGGFPGYGGEFNPDASYVQRRSGRPRPAPFIGGIGSPGARAQPQVDGGVGADLRGRGRRTEITGVWDIKVRYGVQGKTDATGTPRSDFVGRTYTGSKPSVSKVALYPGQAPPYHEGQWEVKQDGVIRWQPTSYGGNPIISIDVVLRQTTSDPINGDPEDDRRKSNTGPSAFTGPGPSSRPGPGPSNRPGPGAYPGPGQSPAPSPASPASPGAPAPAPAGPAPAPGTSPGPITTPAPAPGSRPGPAPAPGSFPGGSPAGPPAQSPPAGSPGGPGNENNRRVPGLFSPGNSPVLPPPVPTGGNRVNTPNLQQPQPAPEPPPLQGQNFNCSRDPCLTGIAARQNQQGQLLDKINLGLQGLDLAQNTVLLNTINSKLGPQIPNGGIGGKLQRFAQSTRLDKIWNALTLMVVLHNAAMLSKNLALTLGDVTSAAINLIVVRDEDDQQIDVNQVVGNLADQFFKNVLGEELWNGTKTTFNRLNRIVTTASNVVYNIRSIADSAREIQNWTAENTGKIGNALKKFRVVPENAYSWMPEQVNQGTALQRRFDKFRDGTENLDEAASSLQGILGEVTNITQEVNEFRENSQKFQQEIQQLQPKPRPDNTPVKESADTSDSVSVSPNIQVSDRDKSEG